MAAVDSELAEGRRAVHRSPHPAAAVADMPSGDAAPAGSYAAHEHGVRLRWLEQQAAQWEAQLGSNFTTNELVERVVVPATKADAPGCSGAVRRYVELLPRGVVARPALFISHAWSRPFCELVANLRAHVDAAPGRDDDPAVWLDMFAVCQHDGDEKNADLAELAAAVRTAGAVAVSVDGRGEPFRRVWCLFEMLTALQVQETRAKGVAATAEVELRRAEDGVIKTNDARIEALQHKLAAERALVVACNKLKDAEELCLTASQRLAQAKLDYGAAAGRDSAGGDPMSDLAARGPLQLMAYGLRGAEFSFVFESLDLRAAKASKESDRQRILAQVREVGVDVAEAKLRTGLRESAFELEAAARTALALAPQQESGNDALAAAVERSAVLLAQLGAGADAVTRADSCLQLRRAALETLSQAEPAEFTSTHATALVAAQRHGADAYDAKRRAHLAAAVEARTTWKDAKEHWSEADSAATASLELREQVARAEQHGDDDREVLDACAALARVHLHPYANRIWHRGFREVALPMLRRCLNAHRALEATSASAIALCCSRLELATMLIRGEPERFGDDDDAIEIERLQVQEGFRLIDECLHPRTVLVADAALFHEIGETCTVLIKRSHKVVSFFPHKKTSLDMLVRAIKLARLRLLLACDALGGNHPAAAEAHEALAQCYGAAAIDLLLRNRDKARTAQREALESAGQAFAKELGDDHPEVARIARKMTHVAGREVWDAIECGHVLEGLRRYMALLRQLRMLAAKKGDAVAPVVGRCELAMMRCRLLLLSSWLPILWTLQRFKDFPACWVIENNGGSSDEDDELSDLAVGMHVLLLPPVGSVVLVLMVMFSLIINPLPFAACALLVLLPAAACALWEFGPFATSTRFLFTLAWVPLAISACISASIFAAALYSYGHCGLPLDGAPPPPLLSLLTPPPLPPPQMPPSPPQGPLALPLSPPPQSPPGYEPHNLCWYVNNSPTAPGLYALGLMVVLASEYVLVALPYWCCGVFWAPSLFLCLDDWASVEGRGWAALSRAERLRDEGLITMLARFIMFGRDLDDGLPARCSWRPDADKRAAADKTQTV